jgi:endoglucanase
MAGHGRRAALAFLLTAEIVVSAIPSGASSAGDPSEQVKRLGRGVNILGYDPIWDNFGDGRFKAKHFKLIRDAGFRSVPSSSALPYGTASAIWTN